MKYKVEFTRGGGNFYNLTRNYTRRVTIQEGKLITPCNKNRDMTSAYVIGKWTTKIVVLNPCDYRLPLLGRNK